MSAAGRAVSNNEAQLQIKSSAAEFYTESRLGTRVWNACGWKDYEVIAPRYPL